MLTKRNFLSGLNISHTSAASGDPSYGIFNGVNIDGRDILACDNFRISYYIMDSAIKGSFVLPFKSASYLIKSELNPSKIFIEKNWVHFLADKEGIILSSVLLEGEYPVEAVKGKLSAEDWSMDFISLPKKIGKMIDRAKVLSFKLDSNLAFVTIEIKSDKITVTSKREFGEYLEAIDGIKIKKPISFKASPDFLNAILKITNKFKISEVSDSLLFSTNKFKHLVLTFSK